MTEQEELRRMVEETAEVIAEIGNEWECDFIEAVSEWNGDFTEAQEAVIRKLYKRACDSPF